MGCYLQQHEVIIMGLSAVLRMGDPEAHGEFLLARFPLVNVMGSQVHSDLAVKAKSNTWAFGAGVY